MITRCYLETTDVCNLNCVFCPKTTRPKRTMTLEEFDLLTSRLAGRVKFLYFHLMGEPFLHPHLPQFVEMARQKGFIPVITTNGTLLSKREDMLEALPHKLQISLHSHEGNGKEDLKQYIDEVMTFAKEAGSHSATLRQGCLHACQRRAMADRLCAPHAGCWLRPSAWRGWFTGKAHGSCCL